MKFQIGDLVTLTEAYRAHHAYGQVFQIDRFRRGALGQTGGFYTTEPDSRGCNGVWGQHAFKLVERKGPW